MKKPLFLLFLIAASPAAAAAIDAGPAPDKWQVMEDRSAMDDSIRVVATLYSADAKSGLMIKCVEGTTLLVVIGEEVLGFDQAAEIAYRIDSAPPVKEEWALISGIGVSPYGNKSIAFIQALPENGKLLFRTRNAQGMERDAVFNLGQKISQVRAQISKACKWK